MSKSYERGIESAVLDLNAEVKDSTCNAGIKAVNRRPSAVEFLRDYVGTSTPLIIRQGCTSMKAFEQWNNDYLIKSVGSTPLTVAATPNGYADAVHHAEDGSSYFVIPDEQKMTMEELLDHCRTKSKGSKRKSTGKVLYLQQQNDNLRTDPAFEVLREDVEESLPFASEAFGAKPEVVNLWIGEDKAVSSLHKDYYENLYCVISGTKDFLLYPPTDLPHMPYKTYPTRQYTEDKTTLKFDLSPVDLPDTEWIDLNKGEARRKKHLLTPIRVSVKAGEIIYIPSLWFHEVNQAAVEKGRTIAVNYFYDMLFDIKWAYYSFLGQVTNYESEERGTKQSTEDSRQRNKGSKSLADEDETDEDEEDEENDDGLIDVGV